MDKEELFDMLITILIYGGWGVFWAIFCFNGWLEEFPNTISKFFVFFGGLIIPAWLGYYFIQPQLTEGLTADVKIFLLDKIFAPVLVALILGGIGYYLTGRFEIGGGGAIVGFVITLAFK